MVPEKKIEINIVHGETINSAAFSGDFTKLINDTANQTIRGSKNTAVTRCLMKCSVPDLFVPIPSTCPNADFDSFILFLKLI